MRQAALYMVGIHDDDRQRNLLQQFAKECGCKIFEDEFIDENPDERRELQRLLSEAGDKQIEAAIIRDLGKLGLTPGLQIEGMLRLFEAGVEIVSVMEALDSATPAGKEFLLRMIVDLEARLSPLPLPRTQGRKSRPGRKPAQFDVEAGIRQRMEDGRSLTEIGEAQGVSKSTAHARITRGIINRLKSILTGQESSGDHQGRGGRQRPRRGSMRRPGWTGGR